MTQRSAQKRVYDVDALDVLPKQHQPIARGRHLRDAQAQLLLHERRSALCMGGFSGFWGRRRPENGSPGGRAGGVAEAEQRLARERHLRVRQAQLLLHGSWSALCVSRILRVFEGFRG